MSDIQEIKQFDKCTLNRMQFKVYTLERTNQKNNKYTDSQMKEKIKEIIKEEVNKCY